ncbi:MAG: PqqD family protein [Bacteroidota bacterium]|nr:PqqD family protein [Bacteroidota bacterium]
MKLKLKEGCVVRKVGNDSVIIPSSGENLNMMRMIKLNSSATFLLEQMQKGEFSRDELVQLLMDKYAIERSTAEKDTDAFIAKLREQSLL